MMRKKRKYVKSGMHEVIRDEYGDKELTIHARLRRLGLKKKR